MERELRREGKRGQIRGYIVFRASHLDLKCVKMCMLLSVALAFCQYILLSYPHMAVPIPVSTFVTIYFSILQTLLRRKMKYSESDSSACKTSDQLLLLGE